MSSPTPPSPPSRGAESIAQVVADELAYAYEAGYTGAQMQEAVRQTLLTAIQPLYAELARKDEALRRVMAETGTSSLAHHAARDALANESEPS